MLSHPLGTLSDIADLSCPRRDPDARLDRLSGPARAVLAAARLPTAIHNALSAYQPQHELVNHYHLGTLVGFFVAAAIGAGRIHALGRSGRLAVTGTVGIAMVAGLVRRMSGRTASRTRWRSSRSRRESCSSESRPMLRSRRRGPCVPHLTHRVEVAHSPGAVHPTRMGQPSHCPRSWRSERSASGSSPTSREIRSERFSRGKTSSSPRT